MRLTFCFSRSCRPKSEVRVPEVRPCWPGLLSNLTLSPIGRRALFRNRSVPSRRESLPLGPRKRATLLPLSNLTQRPQIWTCASLASVVVCAQTVGFMLLLLSHKQKRKSRRCSQSLADDGKRPISDATPLLWTAAVVRHRCHVGDRID